MGLPAPLYIGAAYIPPRSSPYSRDAADDLLAIDKLETLAIEAAEQGALVLIASNLNAHTAALGAPGRRSADDGRRPSARGRRVLELCDNAGLSIANGSVPGATSGDFTFIGDNGCSVVDYFLLCKTLMGAATSLEIERHPSPALTTPRCACASAILPRQYCRGSRLTCCARRRRRAAQSRPSLPSRNSSTSPRCRSRTTLLG